MQRFAAGAVLVVLGLSLGLGPGPLGAQPAPKAFADVGADEGTRLLLEAISKMRKQMMPPLSGEQIARGMLQAYVRSLDPFSAYLTPEEVKQFKRMQEPQYAGVGMDLEQEPSGRIVCFPYPESPATKAGLQAGDILEAVDGVSTAGLSILAVGVKIRGQAGTAVGLRVSKAQGGQKDVQILRGAFEVKSVLVDTQGPVPVVRLTTFTLRTPQELQAALTPLRSAPALVLDLRGNPGGALFGSIEAAKLFLIRGQKIVTLKTQEGAKEYRNDLATPPFLSGALYLWQDAWTASAAEVFLAALSQNQRAASIGTGTFGKGVSQELVPLADGSALKLTTGYLQTPDGTLYHQQGLPPTYPLRTSAATTADYFTQTRMLMDQKVGTSPPSGRVDKVVSPEPASPNRRQAPAVHITLDTPIVPPVPDAPARVSLLCFDKDFDQDNAAESWSMEVRASLRETWDHYLIQRSKPAGIKFIVCLGPFKSQEEAERKRPVLTDVLQTPMFATEVEQNAVP